MICCNIISGFRSTEIFPFNHDTYTGNDFASVKAYDCPTAVADVNEPSKFDAAYEETMAILNEQAINKSTGNVFVELCIPPMILVVVNQKILIHAPQLCFHN